MNTKDVKKTAFMATKNEVKNENKNEVMNNEQMEQFINENISLVPRVMKSRFEKLSIEQKVEKIKDYIQHKQWQAEYQEKNRMVNRVKELFTKRHGTVQDAKEVLEFCNEFINSFKQREIDEIDKQIAALEERKKMLV